MVGQIKLQQYINSLNFGNCPHTLLLQGKRGSGRHLITEQLGKSLNIELMDITKNVNLDFLNSLVERTLPLLCMVDIGKITEREQNILLKIVEEPYSHLFFILIFETESQIIETLHNRGIKLTMEEYSTEDLMPFFKGTSTQKYILEIIRTPGLLQSLNYNNLDGLYSLCEKLITKIGVASLQNTLSIKQKINLSDEFDKFDLYIMLNLLQDMIVKRYIDSGNESLLRMYKIVNDYNNKVYKNFNKSYLMDAFLLDMWEEFHGKN